MRFNCASRPGPAARGERDDDRELERERDAGREDEDGVDEVDEVDEVEDDCPRFRV
jgi:hypothetical protein